MAFDLLESLENPIQFFNWDSRTAIGNCNSETISFGGFHRDYDFPSTGVNLIALTNRLIKVRRNFFFIAEDDRVSRNLFDFDPNFLAERTLP